MADTENTSTAPAPAEGSDDEQKAPWGDDFDAERAWRLVQNLRQERDGLKTERDRLKSELQESRNSSATESEKIADAEKRAKEAEKALYLERVYRKFPALDNDDLRDFLTGETEEEITAKAERLARLGKEPEAPAEGDSQDPADAGDGDGSTEISGKPTPSLVPGHGGEEPPAFDPVAIAKAARR